MRRAVIVDVVRSPFGRGRPGGALDGVHPVDLYAQVLQALVRRTGVDPAMIEDVITGCVIQVAEQSGNIGRQAVLAAGFPETRARRDARSQMRFGAAGVRLRGPGGHRGGVRPRHRWRRGDDEPRADAREPHGQGQRRTGLSSPLPRGLVRQGVSAELIAARWGIGREAMDAFALESHRRAIAAEDRGATARAITPVDVPAPDGLRRVERDEGPRRDSSLEKLGALRPAFEDAATATRFPEIRWSVTAGNSSQVTDGAAAVLIAEESVAVRLGLKPRAAITHFALAGDDPVMMLTAIIPATRKLFSARACPSTASIVSRSTRPLRPSSSRGSRKRAPNPDRVNRWGGAIALGHPVGASGGRLLANLLGTLEETGGRYGLQTMCESGGMANATLIELL